MNTHTDKTSENKSQAVANNLPQQRNNDEMAFQLVDNRPEAIAQRRLQEAINNSPRAKQLQATQKVADNFTTPFRSHNTLPYQLWTLNHQHHYDINAKGIIQGVFDEETITNDIVTHASGIRNAGGSTNEAYIIDTEGEHRQIFIKFTTSDFAVEAARLAAIFGVATPQAISINKESIQTKISELNPGIGQILLKKPHVIAFEFVNGTKVSYESKGKFKEESYRQIGAIAAFDMLIGKTDLFENFEQFDEDQENYNNVKVQGANLIDIDLSASALTPERLRVVTEIIKTPGTVHRFVRDKIGGLFETDDELNLLQIQRSILATVGTVKPEHAEATSNVDVKKTIATFAELAPAALEATEGADAAIENVRQRQQRRPIEAQQEREVYRLEPQVRRQAPRRQRQARVQETKGCCYLTTACCQYYGYADDCEYLMVLRAFRDQWLLQQPDGQALVQVYYDRSPNLIAAIRRRHDEEEIYTIILKGVIMAVEMIKRNEMKKAAAFYQTMSLSLEKAFG